VIGRRRPPQLNEQLAALSQAFDLGEGRLPDATVAGGRQVVAKAQGRLRHGTVHTLVALLGATGGGKSSLANALVGSTIATTGVRRPTTSTTLACFWGDEDPQALLDWLEVPNRHQVTGSDPDLDGLVLLDVPDHDSVELTNRQEMERIAELTDLMLWVTDAEKYGDKAMHAYLRRLHRHGGVIALALNKADQLAPADVERCRRDLAQLLSADGIAHPAIVAISARSGHGLDELKDLLVRTVRERQAMVERLEADIATAASDALLDLGPDGGPGGAAGTGRSRDGVPRSVARQLASELVEGSGLGVVADAVAAGHRRDAALATGWPFTRWVRSLRPHPLRRFHLGRGSGGRASIPQPSGVQRARTEAAVRNAVGAVTANLPDPWPDLIRQAATPDPRTLGDRVDQAVATSARANTASVPRWWRLVNGLQLLAALAAVAGAVWLALLAFGAYLQLPDVPTPSYRRIPVPTALLVGGIGLGWLLALVSARLAAVGAVRRRRAVRNQAEDAVQAVAQELVITPLGAELERRSRLRRLLLEAGATEQPSARPGMQATRPASGGW
jgi:GTPase Era involved in 16S rRNA processing